MVSHVLTKLSPFRVGPQVICQEDLILELITQSWAHYFPIAQVLQAKGEITDKTMSF